MRDSHEDQTWPSQLANEAVEAFRNQAPLDPDNDAFLVVRRGSLWRDIFQLLPESISTIGRDDNNQIVLRDERCSRWHCDVSFQQDRWVVKDLGSRNGTKVAGRKLEGDRGLIEGDIITIGRTEILFTHDISQRLGQSDTSAEEAGSGELPTPEILQRAANSNYFTHAVGGDSSLRSAIANLYEMVVDIASASTAQELANRVLDGMLPTIAADIGAILLIPADTETCTDPDELRVVAYRAPDKIPYQKVSRRLSLSALSEKQGLLALDVDASTDQTEFQSLHDMKAQSVICAPLRFEDRILGLIHIYSLGGKQLDAQALDLTLAVADQVAIQLGNLLKRDALAAVLEQAWDENKRLRGQLEIESDLVGVSEGMQRLRQTIAKVAKSDAAVLVRGESGVGKELVARAVHFNSPRKEAPLVCLNCAALTETLLESELFGHEKGAFTGAHDRSAGKFEQAHEGTLFLDEVGEMPLSIQAKFCEFSRVTPSNALAAISPFVLTSVSSQQRIATWKTRSATTNFAKTCSTGSKFSKSIFRRCGTDATTSCCSLSISWNEPPNDLASRPVSWRTMPSSDCANTTGRGTFASFATSSRERSFFPMIR